MKKWHLLLLGIAGAGLVIAWYTGKLKELVDQLFPVKHNDGGSSGTTGGGGTTTTGGGGTTTTTGGGGTTTTTTTGGGGTTTTTGGGGTTTTTGSGYTTSGWTGQVIGPQYTINGVPITYLTNRGEVIPAWRYEGFSSYEAWRDAKKIYYLDQVPSGASIGVEGYTAEMIKSGLVWKQYGT